MEVPGATPSKLVAQLSKDGHLYLLDAASLGDWTGTRSTSRSRERHVDSHGAGGLPDGDGLVLRLLDDERREHVPGRCQRPRGGRGEDRRGEPARAGDRVVRADGERHDRTDRRRRRTARTTRSSGSRAAASLVGVDGDTGTQLVSNGNCSSVQRWTSPIAVKGVSWPAVTVTFAPGPLSNLGGLMTRRFLIGVMTLAIGCGGGGTGGSTGTAGASGVRRGERDSGHERQRRHERHRWQHSAGTAGTGGSTNPTGTAGTGGSSTARHGRERRTRRAPRRHRRLASGNRRTRRHDRHRGVSGTRRHDRHRGQQRRDRHGGTRRHHGFWRQHAASQPVRHRAQQEPVARRSLRSARADEDRGRDDGRDAGVHGHVQRLDDGVAALLAERARAASAS